MSTGDFIVWPVVFGGLLGLGIHIGRSLMRAECVNRLRQQQAEQHTQLIAAVIRAKREAATAAYALSATRRKQELN